MEKRGVSALARACVYAGAGEEASVGGDMGANAGVSVSVGAGANAGECAGTPAQRALRGALVSLMLEKSFARIGVKELCAAAFVSRSTFYAYYGNIDQLLVEVEDEHVAAIRSLSAPVADAHVAGVDAMGFYDATLAYVRAHASDLRALVVADPDAPFTAKWKAAIKAHLRDGAHERGVAHRAEGRGGSVRRTRERKAERRGAGMSIKIHVLHVMEL